MIIYSMDLCKILWEWFTLQQGKPNDDIGRLMIFVAPVFKLFIIGFINGQNNE